jgi:drug/metabolite transporter, DME family
MTLFFAAMNVTYLSALSWGEASMVIWMQYTAPAWVFLMSWWLLKEKVHRADVTLLISALLGVGTIVWGQVQAYVGQIAAVSLALASGLLLATVVINLRWLREFDSAWLLVLNFLATSIVLAPHTFSHGLIPNGQQLVVLMGFGVLQMGLPYWIFSRAVRHLSGHEASVILLLEPILLPLWVYISWRHLDSYQPPSLATIVGAGIILAGLLARYTIFAQPQEAIVKSDTH